MTYTHLYNTMLPYLEKGSNTPLEAKLQPKSEWELELNGTRLKFILLRSPDILQFTYASGKIEVCRLHQHSTHNLTVYKGSTVWSRHYSSVPYGLKST